MMNILIPIGVLGAMAAVIGIILAYASKKFEVKVNEKVEHVLAVLPGANCGACGYPGCMGYAEAVARGTAPINLCTPGGSDVVVKISGLMGVEGQVSADRKIARVMCQGDNTKTTKKYELDVKIKTCVAANLNFWGDKSCNYGCVGYGDCEKVCPFDAIHVNEKGVAVVDEEKCTACGKCVYICPEHVIKIVPKKGHYSVKCCSKDTGAVTRKACSIGCIACGLCVKNCPVNAITMDNNLAVINPEICVNCGICELKCPTNAIYSDMKEIKKAVIKEDKCVGCTICKKVCPADAIEGEVKQKHKVHEEKCIGCLLCVEKCPVKAIETVTKVKKSK